MGLGKSLDWWSILIACEINEWSMKRWHECSRKDRILKSKIPVTIIIYHKGVKLELVGFKTADYNIAFSVGSTLLSCCINRQLLFTPIHWREVSGIKSRDCRMLIVGKIASRFQTKNNWVRMYCINLSAH